MILSTKYINIFFIVYSKLYICVLVDKFSIAVQNMPIIFVSIKWTVCTTYSLE